MSNFVKTQLTTIIQKCIIMENKGLEKHMKKKDKAVELCYKIKNEYCNKAYIMENKETLIKWIIMFIMIISIFYILLPNASNDDEFEIKNDNKEATASEGEVSKDEQPGTIVIDISGEVVNPMVIELDKDSRVADAIDLAGGLTKNANITTINRAEKLSDGQKISIPSTKEISSTVNAEPESNLININTAVAAELDEIPGVGPSTSSKIIAYREANGRFETIEDIKEVDGIGDKTFEKMQNLIGV